MKKLLKSEQLNNYNDKKKMLTDNHIVLWDVIQSCRRKGSLDSNLRDVKINNFEQLFKNYHTLKAVFCNGQTAYKLFYRYHGENGLPVFAIIRDVSS